MSDRKATSAATTGQSRRGSLSRDQIVEVALELTSRNGLAALSTRSIAREFGVTPMAMYHHVPKMEALRGLVAEAAVQEAFLPYDPRDWELTLREQARALIDALAKYPGVGAYLISTPLQLPTVVEQHRQLRRLLEAAGFSPTDAELARRTYHTFVYGVVALASKGVTHDARRGAPKSQSSFDQWFEFGMSTLLGGLRLQLEGSGLVSADPRTP